MGEWNRIAEIVRQEGYSDVELQTILRELYNLLESDLSIPCERELLIRAINRSLRMLKVKVEEKGKKEGTKFLLEALRYLLHEDFFDVDALNLLLKEIKVPYHYVLNKDTPLKKGIFKLGYVRECKEKMKYDRIFISHSSKDREITNAFVELLEDIGLGVDEIFYSSLAEYGVSLGENIVDAIKRELSNKKVHVVFLLSQNYYDSVICLNEMGAAWVMQHTYTSLLLPGYEYKNIKGAIDAGCIGIKLDGDQSELRDRLIEFRNQIQKEFCLAPLDERKWNRKLDNFVERVNKVWKCAPD